SVVLGARAAHRAARGDHAGPLGRSRKSARSLSVPPGGHAMELGRLGVWCSLESGSLAQAVEAAQRIEALGYSALWQPMALRRDVMVTASLQLAATKRLVVATGLPPTYEAAPPAGAPGRGPPGG